MMKPSYKGQSITEYAVILVLVAVASISGLVALKDVVQSNFQAINSGTSLSRTTARIAPPQPTLILANGPVVSQAPVTLQTPQSAQPVVPPVDTTAVMGTSLNSNSNGQAETAGSMGGSNSVSKSTAVLQSLAAQLAQDPNADPQVVQMVTQLANSGHQLGTAASTLAIGGIVSSAETFQTTDAQLKIYLQAHPNALPQGSIDAIDGAFHNIVSSVSNNPLGSSSSINNNANTICQNGGNTSQCVTTSASSNGNN